jgi:hypothetical protein
MHSGACRGSTVIDDAAPLSASAFKKSRLYCAIPPYPPNASVTRARTDRHAVTPSPLQSYAALFATSGATSVPWTRLDGLPQPTHPL